MAKAADGPRATLAARAKGVIDRLMERLKASEEEKAALVADATKADSILEPAVAKAEKFLALFIFACALGLALYYAPGNEGRQVAGAGFTHSLTQS